SGQIIFIEHLALAPERIETDPSLRIERVETMRKLALGRRAGEARRALAQSILRDVGLPFLRQELRDLSVGMPRHRGKVDIDDRDSLRGGCRLLVLIH